MMPMRSQLALSFLLVVGVAGGCGGASHGSSDALSPPDLALDYEAAVRAATWTAIPGAPTVKMGKQDDIWFTSAQRGFAVSGPASSIYRTIDGGTTWTTIKKLTGTYFRSILFIDDQHGFASNLGAIASSGITDTNVLYQTSDGGDTWAAVTNITGPMPPGICNQTLIDATHQIAVGRVTGPSYLLSSSDSGAHFASTDLTAQLSMLIDARFTTLTNGFVVGGTATSPMRCTILKTTDGTTFTTAFTSANDNTLCWKISFPSANVGYVSIQSVDGASDPATFAKTTDGGQTWTEKPFNEAPYATIGIGFITDSIGWAVSEDPNDSAYRTFDGGDTWEVEPALAPPINRFRFVDKQTAYAIGGTIYRLNINWPTP